MSSVSPTKSLPHTDSMPSPAPASLWSQLLHKMHPRTCLSAVNSDLPLDVEFPLIYTDLQPSASLKMQTKALQKLYELTSQKNQLYRLELVAKHNALDLLADLLSKSDHRRVAWLTLNNLSIPYENKGAILTHTPLLKQLWCILCDLPPADTYVACQCLRNLCRDETSRTRLLHYRPSSPPTTVSMPKDDSLLSLQEKLFVTFAPDVLRTGKVNSAEGYALKWSAGLLQLISSTNASVLMPFKDLLRTMLELLQYLSINLPLHEWTQDSLPDACLVVILQVACQPNADLSIIKDAPTYLSHLIGKGGIHDTRASWIQCLLDEL